jgi:ABC-type polysaccharide/polyol phosphate export permease
VDAARSLRVRAVSLIGPATSAGGLIWAVLQPYRVTLLHPRGQGFWWLLVEPPLLVAIAGVLFALVVAKPLLADLEEHDAAAR